MSFYEDFLLFREYLKGFVGKTEGELLQKVNLETKSKSKLFMLSKSICKSFLNPLYFNSMVKYKNIVLKTIQLEDNGRPRESMSFSPFKYKEIANETWETSTVRNFFSDSLFLFFIFKKDKYKNNILIKIGLWKMPLSDLEGELKDVWLKTVLLIREGNIVKRVEGYRVITNFPKEAETIKIHVRPHGASGSDMDRLPVVDKVTGYRNLVKHAFWFNHNYVIDISKQSEAI